MERKAVLEIMLTLLLLVILTSPVHIQPAKASPRTWTVDDDGPADFYTIQEAVYHANEGDVIYVEKGTYFENVVVHKSVSLIGANRTETIIDGRRLGTSLYVSAHNVVVSGFTVQNGRWEAIAVWNTENITVTNNILRDSTFGVFIANSERNNVTDNLVSGNKCGIAAEGKPSSYNVITSNTLTNNQWGIEIGPTGNRRNTVKGNRIVGGTMGLMLDDSHENDVYQNDIVGSMTGIEIYYAQNNTISENNVTANSRAVSVVVSSGNKVFHNNFINNPTQVWTYNSVCSWDDCYPSGGNYWSDYSDVDSYNGPDQDLSGMDGIWDHPYIIDASNTDRYPLVKPWPTIPATLDADPDTLNLRSRSKWITIYIELPTRYDIDNIDVSTIMLNDTFSADFTAPTQIGDYDLDGIPDLMVKFNRTQLELYIYHVLSIKYGLVTFKITGKLLDGTPFEGQDTITVNFAGDVNNDGIVNILDAAGVSAHWYPGPPTGPSGYDASADLNNDGLINILDSGIVSSNWGQTVP